VSRSFTVLEPKEPGDFASLAALARQLAAYHGDAFDPSAEALSADHGTWYRAALAQTPDGTAIGFAGWHRLYWVQLAKRAIELQNLFVVPEWRDRKVGLALVRHVVQATLAASTDVLRISVRKDNARAIAFYDSIGCTRQDRGPNWACRLDRVQMQRLLSTDAPGDA